MLDFAALQEFVYSNRIVDSTIHGLSHWRQVEFNGLLLALFHDCKREDDGYDGEHGERSAAFAKECFEKGLLEITQEQFDQLYHACFYHTKEHQTDDPTINTCYDADRLDLGRVGMSLNPKKMATAPGARIAHKSLRANVDVYKMREWLKTIAL